MVRWLQHARIIFLEYITATILEEKGYRLQMERNGPKQDQ